MKQEEKRFKMIRARFKKRLNLTEKEMYELEEFMLDTSTGDYNLAHFIKGVVDAYAPPRSLRNPSKR